MSGLGSSERGTTAGVRVTKACWGIQAVVQASHASARIEPALRTLNGRGRGR